MNNTSVLTAGSAILFAGISFGGLTGKASAGTVLDLTTGIGARGYIGDAPARALFVADYVDTSSGTGVFQPFVRIQQTPEQEGFNTSLAPMDDVKTGKWTHDVQLSQLQVTTFEGKDYVKLALDIGEPSASSKSKLSITDIKVFVRDQPLTIGNSTTQLFAAPNVPLFAFSDGDRIDLDYNLIGSGNGRSDMFFYLPADLFSGYEADDYFYLYSKMGAAEEPGVKNPAPAPTGPYPSEGSFEEWAVISTGRSLDFSVPMVPVPEPSALFFGIALVSFAGLARPRIS